MINSSRKIGLDGLGLFCFPMLSQSNPSKNSSFFLALLTVPLFAWFSRKPSFVCIFKGVLMTGSLCMNHGILQTVKTSSVQCLEKIHQQQSAWKDHMLQGSVGHHLQCLFARNVPSWLRLIFLMKNFW